MKIVLDTNVLISSLLNPNGNPAGILNLILNDKLILLYDNRILSEYSEVLKRDKFGFNDGLIQALLDYFSHEGIYISAEPVNTEFKDEDDKKFYEVFKSGNADFLISGTLIHFPKETKILQPTDFLKEYYKRTSIK